MTIQSISKAVKKTGDLPSNPQVQATTPSAQAGWEYLTLVYNFSYGSTTYVINGEKEVSLKNRLLHDVLTHYGQSGWELIGISEGTYIFKRLTNQKPTTNGADKLSE
jgi:hypothetical protein